MSRTTRRPVFRAERRGRARHPVAASVRNAAGACLAWLIFVLPAGMGAMALAGGPAWADTVAHAAPPVAAAAGPAGAVKPAPAAKPAARPA
ncbi:MAG: hypothetical protein KGL52_07960, partial [Rhodospirillales bacterium]|nr:hypothetical protein [Rhodospirillales bacterium]